MRVTRRFWTVAGVGITLAGWGVVTASPSLIVGTGTIGAWLLVVQYGFLREIQRTLPALEVGVECDADRVTARETSDVAVAASVGVATALSIEVTATTPVGVDGPIEALRLDQSDHRRQHNSVYWPIAGEFEFATPQVTFLDRFGLFTQTIAHGTSPTVIVRPRAPRNVHLGQGGEAIRTGFGEHETGETGSGLKPAEVREYVPSDAASEIDWKATARLAEPYVREYEVETDRETNLFVDHRHSMGQGPDGACKLDYARQLALAVLAGAQHQGDPIGCYTIGDEGLTASYDPSTTADHVTALRQEVLSLSPTAPEGADTTAFSPAVARRQSQYLTDDASPFATTLRPYFTAQTQYVQRIESTPLFAAVNLHQPGQRRTAWSVLITDDTNRTEVRESVKLARQLEAHVTVYLTPTVLFEEGVLGDVAAAYDRYADFESFRHDLDSLAGVSAFEIGPADRLSAILGAEQTGSRGVRT